jgi:hypothetical protein
MQQATWEQQVHMQQQEVMAPAMQQSNYMQDPMQQQYMEAVNPSAPTSPYTHLQGASCTEHIQPCNIAEGVLLWLRMQLAVAVLCHRERCERSSQQSGSREVHGGPRASPATPCCCLVVGTEQALWREGQTQRHLPQVRSWGTYGPMGNPHEPLARWLVPRFGIPSHNYYCTVLYCTVLYCTVLYRYGVC